MDANTIDSPNTRYSDKPCAVIYIYIHIERSEAVDRECYIDMHVCMCPGDM